MGKYSDGSSIPIDTLSQEELAVAIKEWAEGNPIAEKMLWTFYNKGVETSGCHTGINPYVDFNYNPKNSDIYINLMNGALLSKGAQVLIVADGGNPFSGRDWYLPNINLGIFSSDKDVVNGFIENIDKAMDDEKEISSEIDTSSLIDLLEFFKGKLTRLLFRIRHNDDDTFTFSVENRANEDSELFKYLCECLIPLGFTLKTSDEGPYKSWEFVAKDKDELNKILVDATTVLIKNYSLKTPTSIEETDDFYIQAHILRTQLPEEEFKEWLYSEREKRFGIPKPKK